MPGFTESSIILNFPDANFFRFADCQGFKKLSGHNFKEMDACWYDKNQNQYWLIELKDYTVVNLSESDNVEKRAWDITKKAYDTVSMFISSKHGYPYSNNITPCIPEINDTIQLRVVTVVHCESAQASDVQLLHNSFRHKFKPYAELFGITSYGVIEHSKAIKSMPQNIVQ